MKSAHVTIEYNGNQFNVKVSGERRDVVETLIAVSQMDLLQSSATENFALTDDEMKRITERKAEKERGVTITKDNRLKDVFIRNGMLPDNPEKD